MSNTMRAVTVGKYGGPQALQVRDVPLPEPGTGQVRIKVAAAAVNPIDALIRDGSLAGAVEDREYYVPGLDVAGVIDAIGPGLDTFTPGDAVVGLSPWFQSLAGTHAEYVVVPAAGISPAPRSVTLEEAATVPMNGITALLALNAINARPGSVVLVTGAAGGVGRYLVELASRRGATVLAFARASDGPLLTSLGAAHVLDRDGDLMAQVHDLAAEGVDGVVDTAALGKAVLPALRDGGRFAALVASAVPEAERDIAVTAIQQAPDRELLTELVFAVERGHLTTGAVDTYPLQEAQQAHARLAQKQLRSRLVLVP